jgi:SAM-dependent methyltransferase
MTGYAVTARYYDPLASITHAGVDAQIAAALGGLASDAGPILDIGAGTGLSTALIAATLPASEIIAVEPDPAMLPALMTRVWSDVDLRQRVTILPFGIFEAPLPRSIGGALLSASLVHFGPDERARLWRLLGDRLAEHGRIIAEVQCSQADDIPESDMAQARVGNVMYSGTASAQRIAPDRQRWTMSYRASLDAREIARDVVTYDCWAISAEMIVAEAGLAGLSARVLSDLVLLNR